MLKKKIELFENLYYRLATADSVTHYMASKAEEHAEMMLNQIRKMILDDLKDQAVKYLEETLRFDDIAGLEHPSEMKAFKMNSIQIKPQLFTLMEEYFDLADPLMIPQIAIKYPKGQTLVYKGCVLYRTSMSLMSFKWQRAEMGDYTQVGKAA